MDSKLTEAELENLLDVDQKYCPNEKDMEKLKQDVDRLKQALEWADPLTFSRFFPSTTK